MCSPNPTQVTPNYENFTSILFTLHNNICQLLLPGVSTALRLQRALGLRRCSFEGMPEGDHLAAQNKFLQNENGRRAGLKTVRQVLARQWSEAEPFVDELLGSATSDAASFVVIKPYRGVASDGVFKAGSRREARQAFESLLGGARFGGGANDAVLLQEFASGTEYAVDTVARDGEVKVVALWRYRKLAANGAPFVYQCRYAAKGIYYRLSSSYSSRVVLCVKRTGGCIK